MSQISFANADYTSKRKKTRREVFLEEMELVVPWKAAPRTTAIAIVRLRSTNFGLPILIAASPFHRYRTGIQD